MIVYVVTDGEYSDYHIEAVFTDKEQAELYCATHNLLTDSIEEYDTEEHKFESSTPVYSQWRYRIEERKNGNATFYFSYVTFTTEKKDRFEHVNSIFGESAPVVDARIVLEKDATAEQAKKAAYDRYAKWKYENFA